MEFVLGMFVGVVVATCVMALLQANRDNTEKERADHAVNRGNWYKAKCKELQEKVDKYEKGGAE